MLQTLVFRRYECIEQMRGVSRWMMRYINLLFIYLGPWHTIQVLRLKLLAPESCTSNFAHLSCILVPDLFITRSLDRIEHVLLLPSFWCNVLVPVTWTENMDCVPYGKSHFLCPSSGWQLSICQLHNQHLQSTRHCHIRTPECQINAATLSRPQDCTETHWTLN